MRNLPNVSRFGSKNAFEATLADGTIVLVSYRTPVAALVRQPDGTIEVLVASETISPITTRQIGEWLHGRHTRAGLDRSLGERHLGLSRAGWYRLFLGSERQVPAAEISARYAHLIPLGRLPVHTSPHYHGYPRGSRSAAIPDRLVRLGVAH